jgi:hypothetical protein
MQTRSKTRELILSVDIDFDASSRAWMQNKKRVGQIYKYICGKQLDKGKICQRRPVLNQEFCRSHL